eukprot:661998-Amphidinium_carterae.1
MENYYVEMDILQEVLKKKYADNYGEIEDADEYKTARENRDDGEDQGTLLQEPPMPTRPPPIPVSHEKNSRTWRIRCKERRCQQHQEDCSR